MTHLQTLTQYFHFWLYADIPFYICFKTLLFTFWLHWNQSNCQSLLIRWIYLNNVCIGPALVRLVVLCVFEQDLVHVSTGILEQLVCMVKDDQSNLAVTQHTQLIGFLHQTKLSLCECHLRQNGRESCGGGNRAEGEKKQKHASFSSVNLNNLSRLTEYCHIPFIKN